MNAIYVYAKHADPSCWIGNVIGTESNPSSLSPDELDASWVNGWVHCDGVSQEIRYRWHYPDVCFGETEDDEGADEDHVMREVLVDAMAAMNTIEVDSRLLPSAPFWISNREDFLTFEMALLVRLRIRFASECPDVQACISDLAQFDPGAEDPPWWARELENAQTQPHRFSASARRVAEQIRIEENMVLACETDAARVVLRLGTQVGLDLLRAQANGCGASPLSKGDILSRTLVGFDGQKFASVVGEVVAVDAKSLLIRPPC